MGEISILHNVVGPARVGGDRSRWLGSPTAASRIVILNGLADRWEARSSGGAFSLKWAPIGRAVYRSQAATHVVRPRGFMLLNPGQDYEMRIAERTETFCVFFPEVMVREAWGSDAPAEFPNVVFRPGFGAEVARLRDALEDGEAWPEDLEARLMLILDGALAAARLHRGQAARTGAVRAATRRRLLARLEVARELIADGEAPNLDRVARAAGLSKFHLVRLFKAAYGATPMRYAEGLRLDRAAERLRRGQGLVDDIAYAAGYDSPSAFGRAFRRRFGASPSAFRQAAR